MKNTGNNHPETPRWGSDPARFIPFEDAATGRLNWPLPPPDRTEVHIDKKTLLLKTKRIIAITAYDKYVFFHSCIKGDNQRVEKLMVRCTLRHFDEVLFAFGFLRIHDSFIINIRHLRSVVGNMPLLSRKLGADIIISDSYKPLFEKALSIFANHESSS